MLLRVIKKIKVLIIDDSIVFSKAIAWGMAEDPGIEVVGTAADPFIARDKILELEPDVLTLDVEMPRMNGIEFLRKLMPQYPLPVIVVSAIGSSVLDALEAGAVEFIAKPDLINKDVLNNFINELIVKVKIASIAKVGQINRNSAAVKTEANTSLIKENIVIAIGASTGGTEAIYKVVKNFPRDMPGVVIVQHMPPVFTHIYADRLNGSCSMEVREAQDGDAVKPGKILIAPGGYQMELRKGRNNYYVKCYKGERVNGQCPSVDVLFNSVADHAGSDAVGVILTGMGCDGSKGLLNMRNKGAYTIGQDAKTSIVYGMPMVAFDIGAVKTQVSLERISETICNYLNLKISKQ